jgi:hypothetical protein
MNSKNAFTSFLLLCALALILVQASDVRGQRRYAFNASGTWFGNALPDKPETSPFPEVVMIPTFLPDGTVIADDSQNLNAAHSTAHGVWIQNGFSLQATFIWLNLGTAGQGLPNGYAGTIKIRMSAYVIPPAVNIMKGTLSGVFFPPGTDPLDPADTGGIPIGTFTIQKLQRLTLQ